jgi:hypothetical protein
MKSVELKLGNFYFLGCPNGVPARNMPGQGWTGVGGTYVALVVGSSPVFFLNCA